MEARTWKLEEKPGNPHPHAKLVIGKPEAMPTNCTELAVWAKPRSRTTLVEPTDPGD